VHLKVAARAIRGGRHTHTTPFLYAKSSLRQVKNMGVILSDQAAFLRSRANRRLVVNYMGTDAWFTPAPPLSQCPVALIRKHLYCIHGCKRLQPAKVFLKASRHPGNKNNVCNACVRAIYKAVTRPPPSVVEEDAARTLATFDGRGGAPVAVATATATTTTTTATATCGPSPPSSPTYGPILCNAYPSTMPRDDVHPSRHTPHTGLDVSRVITAAYCLSPRRLAQMQTQDMIRFFERLDVPDTWCTRAAFLSAQRHNN
jgi:hypothetical protein